MAGDFSYLTQLLPYSDSYWHLPIYDECMDDLYNLQNGDLPDDPEADSIVNGVDITSLEEISESEEESVLDQDSDNPPAGTPGHPGIDEDTA